MDFLTVAVEPTVTEIVVEKSRFIAVVQRVTKAPEIENRLAAVRKKYPAATHYCYAAVTTETQRSSDDGEPPGTAGRPIMAALTKQKLQNVLVVVVRYFGGVKLGTGGLARAYGRAATEALVRAKKVLLKQCTLLQVQGSYQQANTIQNVTALFGQVLGKSYQNGVVYRVAIPTAQGAAYQHKLQASLHGLVAVTVLGIDQVEFAL